MIFYSLIHNLFQLPNPAINMNVTQSGYHCRKRNLNGNLCRGIFLPLFHWLVLLFEPPARLKCLDALCLLLLPVFIPPLPREDVDDHHDEYKNLEVFTSPLRCVIVFLSLVAPFRVLC